MQLDKIVDMNTRTVAIGLQENGFDLFHTTPVGDDPDSIALAASASLRLSGILGAAAGRFSGRLS